MVLPIAMYMISDGLWSDFNDVFCTGCCVCGMNIVLFLPDGGNGFCMQLIKRKKE